MAGQNAGNPDSDGDGWGLKFVPGAATGRDIYLTGIVGPAIVQGVGAADMNTVVPVPTGGWPGGFPLAGQTYRDMAIDMVDYLAFAQNEPNAGVGRGGWRYSANNSTSDNSTSQWPVVAMLYGNSWGASAPPWVASELSMWVDYIQHYPGDGGSDYDNGHGWGSNVSRTGTLALQMDYVNGVIPGTYPSTPGGRLDSALGYLDNQWQTTANSTWNGNFGHPYAMWATYKGLESTVGLGDTTTITNLHAPAPVDPGDNWTWWEDYCEWLVNNQNADGSWNGYTSYWDNDITTAWYVNILAATDIPDEVPEPAAILLMGTGLLGLLGIGIRRRRKMK
jgi:hypothetical protein